MATCNDYDEIEPKEEAEVDGITKSNKQSKQLKKQWNKVKKAVRSTFSRKSSSDGSEIEHNVQIGSDSNDSEFEDSDITNCTTTPTEEKHDSDEKEQDTRSIISKKLRKAVPLSTSERKLLQPISRKEAMPQIYKLHISKVFQDNTYTRYAVGSPSVHLDRLTMASERVLMLVGATGTGKTTLINGIANYIYGTEWKDNFRLSIVHKEGHRSQAFSQTKQIAAYTFPAQKGSPLPYTLTVVDTPGFGDADGITHDRYIVEQINNFFSFKPPDGIGFLHGIGFVVKASDGRLTPMQLYVFNSILGIFGRDVEEMSKRISL